MAIDRYYTKKNYTDEHAEEFAAMSRSGAVALYLYSKKAFVNGESLPLSKKDEELRAIAVCGEVFVPVSFFSDYLGCEVSGGETECEIKKNGVTVKAKTDSAEGFKIAPRISSGVLFVPVIEVARKLSMDARAYYTGMLVFIGTKEQHGRLMADENLVEAGCFAVFGKYDPSLATAEDYAVAKKVFRERLVGNPEINDMDDPFIAEKVKRISDRCAQMWERLNKEEGRVNLWGKSAPVESDQLSIQFGGVSDLALGWGTYGSEYYHNEKLLADIISALEWLNANMYGEKEMRNEGWRDVLAFNWWHWLSGATDPMTDAILIIEDKLTREQIMRFTATYDGIRHYLHNGPSSKVMTKLGLLREDLEKFEDCNAMCENTLIISDSGERHSDYLNFTHGFPHNISYGTLIIENSLYVLSALAKTRLAYVGPKKYNYFHFLKYMYEPSIFNGRGYLMYLGRTTRGVEMGSGGKALSCLLRLIGVFGEEEDRYIKTFIKRQVKNYEKVKRNMIKWSLSFLDIAILKDILSDDTIPDKAPYEIGYVWYTGDRASWQRNNYGAAIAMASRRSFTYESINDMNKAGWYTGDGALYIYTDQDEYCYDGANFLDKNMEVAYHFPGTTEDQRQRAIRSIRNPHAWRNPTDFSGGVQLKKKFVTAGMEFIAMNYEGADDKEDVGYGGGLAPHKNDLRAKKAYFCFDREVVALGAGITSTMNSPVNTTIDHRRIVREDEFSQFVDNERVPKHSFVREYEGARTFLMEGHAGFVILDGGRTLVRRYISDTAGGQSFMEYRIQHGENPTDATYAYATLPYATREELENYASAPTVEIISNTPSLQAVREKNLGILGIVFHECGECEGIKVDTPSFVMTDADELSISEPSGKVSAVTLTLLGEREIKALDDKMEYSYEGGNTIIKINTEGANGKPFTVKF